MFSQAKTVLLTTFVALFAPLKGLSMQEPKVPETCPGGTPPSKRGRGGYSKNAPNVIIGVRVLLAELRASYKNDYGMSN